MCANNKEMNIADSVILKLETAGFRAALIPFSCIEQITKIHDTHVDNSENTPFNIKNRFHSNQPPDITFEPLSFLVIAFQSSEGEVCFNYKGKKISIPIPPTYLDDSAKRRLNEALKLAAENYQLAGAKGISLKLLAVLSGLGKYGRNALCYLEEFGSFCNFDAYYTDIPCEDKHHKIAFMDICESCGLCIKNCPTEALGGQLAIDTSRCLTMLNEFKSPMPEWLLPSVHHAIVGCMRCHEICPVNKSVPKNKKEAFELSELETEILLTSSSEKLPPELVKRLSDYGLWQNFIALAGRNAKLAIEAIGD